MKNICFFVQWMLCGGVENALVALSKELVKRGNNVTIYVIKEKGEFINKVPKEVHLKLIPMDEKIRNSIPIGGTKVTVRECLDDRRYLDAFKFVVKHKLCNNSFAELNVKLKAIPKLKENYDIAINFHMHSPFLVWYLSERVSSNKKYTWIHNDFTTTNYNVRKLNPYLDCVDRFFAVSNQVRNEFIRIVPEFNLKTVTALNIVLVDEILKRAEEYYPKEFTTAKGLKLLTVGRLEEQKGYDIAINVCEKMKRSGLNFQWFVLGEGTQRERLENEINKKGLTNDFHLLGARTNPYPYFKNCDIYVQTSRHEGYVTTVTEAKLFDRPIVITDFAGAREQIKDGVTGRIVKVDADAIFAALKETIDNSILRKMYSQNLHKVPYYQNVDYITQYF